MYVDICITLKARKNITDKYFVDPLSSNG